MSIDFSIFKIYYYTLKFSFNMSARKLTYIKRRPNSEVEEGVLSELAGAFCSFNEKVYSDWLLYKKHTEDEEPVMPKRMIWVVTSNKLKTQIKQFILFRSVNWDADFLAFLFDSIIVFKYGIDYIPKQVKDTADICLCSFDMNKVKIDYLIETYHIDVFGIGTTNNFINRKGR